EGAPTVCAFSNHGASDCAGRVNEPDCGRDVPAPQCPWFAMRPQSQASNAQTERARQRLASRGATVCAVWRKDDSAMPVKTPTLEELGRIASRYGLSVTQDDLRSYQGLMDGMLASYNRLDQLPEPTLAVKYPRDAGYRP